MLNPIVRSDNLDDGYQIPPYTAALWDLIYSRIRYQCKILAKVLKIPLSSASEILAKTLNFSSWHQMQMFFKELRKIDVALSDDNQWGKDNSPELERALGYLKLLKEQTDVTREFPLDWSTAASHLTKVTPVLNLEEGVEYLDSYREIREELFCYTIWLGHRKILSSTLAERIEDIAFIIGSELYPKEKDWDDMLEKGFPIAARMYGLSGVATLRKAVDRNHLNDEDQIDSCRRAYVAAQKNEAMSQGIEAAAVGRIESVRFWAATISKISQFMLDGRTDNGPVVALALNNLPDDAEMSIELVANRKNDAPFFTVDNKIFVRLAEDIPKALASSPRMPDRIYTVTKDSAEKLKKPGLAGWYEIYWA